ncbi:MAG: CPBP family intramembrane glutamic endopeptidase [Gammaproteobacteria bacterium]
MVDSLPSSPAPDRGGSTPWSAGQTLAFAGAIAIALPFLNMVVAMLMAGFAAAENSDFNQQLFYLNLRENGQYLTVASLVANGFIVWAVLRLIRLRGSVSWPRYLAIRPASATAWITALAGTLVLLVVSQWIGDWMQRPLYPDFLIEVYRSAQPLPLFWLVVVALSPIAEEVYFRGFIFIGLRNSLLGVSGAIIVTALLWSIIHLQYDFYDKSLIFIWGLFLGWLRFRYNTLVLPVLMHCLVNLVTLWGLASALT